MRLWSVVKWASYLLGALCTGIILGLPQGTASAQLKQVQASTEGFILPVVETTTNDYRASDGVVQEFQGWAHGPVCSNFEARYPPSKIIPERQKAFFIRVVSEAVEQGELEPVISGCAMNAITIANSEEKRDPAGSGSSPPNTILIYAERAQYFGQDVWCFICLSTVDGRQGSVRVLAMSCVPPFGLIHIERIDRY